MSTPCGLRNAERAVLASTCRRLASLLLCGALLLSGPAAGGAVELKIWPLFHYRHDSAEGRTRLRVFGPLVDYEAEADRRTRGCMLPPPIPDPRFCTTSVRAATTNRDAFGVSLA